MTWWRDSSSRRRRRRRRRRRVSRHHLHATLALISHKLETNYPRQLLQKKISLQQMHPSNVATTGGGGT
jgi:hypothetical protein